MRVLQWGAHAPCAPQGYSAPSTYADSRPYRISHLARRSPSALCSDGIIGRHRISRTGNRGMFPALTNPGFVKRRSALQPRGEFGELDPGIHAAVEKPGRSFPVALIGFMIIDGCGAAVGLDRSNN